MGGRVDLMVGNLWVRWIDGWRDECVDEWTDDLRVNRLLDYWMDDWIDG